MKYSGKLFDVVETPMAVDGTRLYFESARRPPGVRIIIIDGRNILLTKEYRSELQRWDVRVPGGKVFDSSSEYATFNQSGADIVSAAEAAASREAVEEVGLKPLALEHFATSQAGATITWDLLYFVARRYEHAPGGQHAEVGEVIDPIWCDATTVAHYCLDGTISEDRSSAILLRFIRAEYPLVLQVADHGIRPTRQHKLA